jgi:hypothetical protein
LNSVGDQVGFRTFLPDPDPESSPLGPDPDLDPALVKTIYQVIVFKTMFFTNFLKIVMI